MSKKSPTQRTLDALRAEGYAAEVVEKRIPYTRITKDLFGCIDIVAVKAGLPPLAVQATSKSNVSARLKKSRAAPDLRAWLGSGCLFEVWGWGLTGAAGTRKRYEVRKEPVTLPDLTSENES